MIDALRQLRARMANLVSRAVVRLVDDSPKMQLVQLAALEGETREGVERFQNYGFTGRPETGAEAVVLFVGGYRDHGLAIAVDDRRYRVRNLESGEVAVYDSRGSTIVLKASGDIQIVPASGTVTIEGTLAATVDVTANGISLANHQHSAGALANGAGPVTGLTGGPL
jgi:phage gp45-like